MKPILSILMICLFFFNITEGKGGIAPCLATCILGDTRVGLEMNDGVPLESYDWTRLALNGIGAVAFPAGYLGGSLLLSGIGLLSLGISGGFRFCAIYEQWESEGLMGCIAANIWGYRAGRDINKIRIRNIEVLACIHVVDIFPAIWIPLEAFQGKTYQEVIEKEHLRKEASSE
jgi:hypothetical protein